MEVADCIGLLRHFPHHSWYGQASRGASELPGVFSVTLVAVFWTSSRVFLHLLRQHGFLHFCTNHGCRGKPFLSRSIMESVSLLVMNCGMTWSPHTNSIFFYPGSVAATGSVKIALCGCAWEPHSATLGCRH